MYVIQCTKSGVGDFYFNNSCYLGAWFRMNQYITDGGEPTRSLNQAITFRTKEAVREFMDGFNSDLNEDDEPIPEFETVPVTLSLK